MWSNIDEKRFKRFQNIPGTINKYWPEKETAMPVALHRPPRTVGPICMLERRQQWKLWLLNKYTERIKSILTSTYGSVQRLAKGWAARGSNPSTGECSAPTHTAPGTHPASYTVRTGSFPGVKRPRCGADHPPLLAPRLKTDTPIPLLPLSAFLAGYRVNFTFILLTSTYWRQNSGDK